MIVHAVDALQAQGSAYEAAYAAAAPQAPAAPLARVASNAPVAVAAAQPRGEPAPCSIQRGYADLNGWGGVVAECSGTVVSVGGQLVVAGRNAAGGRDLARRLLQGSLESDSPASDRLALPSFLLLMLAGLALYFVARSFREEPYRG
jgi:hypothetical protein